MTYDVRSSECIVPSVNEVTGVDTARLFRTARLCLRGILLYINPHTFHCVWGFVVGVCVVVVIESCYCELSCFDHHGASQEEKPFSNVGTL